MCYGRPIWPLKTKVETILIITWFHLVCPKWQFSYVSAKPLCGLSVACEMGTPKSWIDVFISNIRRHSYPYIAVLPMIWWDTDAPDHPFHRNPRYHLILWPASGVLCLNFFTRRIRSGHVTISKPTMITCYHMIPYGASEWGVLPAMALTSCTISFTRDVGDWPLGVWSWILPHTNTHLLLHGPNL